MPEINSYLDLKLILAIIKYFDIPYPITFALQFMHETF
jgi:hypothetical protein